MKVTLCDISHGGLGISLPEGMNPSVVAKQRIAELITAFQPIADAPTQGTVD